MGGEKVRHWKFYAGFFFIFLGSISLYDYLLAWRFHEEGIWFLMAVVVWFVLALASWVDYRKIANSTHSEQKKEGEGKL